VIDIAQLQRRLAAHGYSLSADGIAGPKTWTALFAVGGASASAAAAYGAAAAAGWTGAGIDVAPLRVAHFMGQTATETGGFRYSVELGDAAYFAHYDGRLGNGPGDGYAYRGRGLVMLTGRANYAEAGAAIGLSLVAQPDLAADPATAMRIACHFWVTRRIARLADADDVVSVTRAINGGLNGIDDRRRRTAIYKGLLL